MPAMAFEFKHATCPVLPDMDLTIDLLSDHEQGQSCESLPEIEEMQVLPEIAQHRRLVDVDRRQHVGDIISVQSKTLDKTVDAMVIDAGVGVLKVAYCCGSKCYTKVVPSPGAPKDLQPKGRAPEPKGMAQEPKGMAWHNGMFALVRNSTSNSWFHGTITASDGVEVTVRFRHNGKFVKRTLPKTSADIRLCSQTPFNASVTANDRREL